MAIQTVTLGMYDAPWCQPAQDALWAVLADHLRAAGIDGVPDRLDRSRSIEAALADPALLLGQTCGYPLVTSLAARVRLVATPVYATPFTQGPLYSSVLVVRSDDPAVSIADVAGRRAAINGWDSNSGMNMLRAVVAPHARDGRFFGAVSVTGGHVASMAAVRAGQADVAAIDGVTFDLATRHAPDAVAGLRIIGATPLTPGLPFVTATSDEDVEALAAAIAASIGDARAATAVAHLGLTGVVRLDLADYAVIKRWEESAAEAGYPVLA